MDPAEASGHTLALQHPFFAHTALVETKGWRGTLGPVHLGSKRQGLAGGTAARQKVDSVSLQILVSTGARPLPQSGYTAG